MHHTGSRGAGVETFATVTDGSSNTLLVGEYHTRTQNSRRTFWAYTYTSYNQSSVTAGQPRTLIADYQACQQIGGTGGSNPCKRGWGTLHASGVIHFLMGDGRVRPISLNVNMDILVKLASIHGDGEQFFGAY
jgi:hypothetical protein